MGRKAKTREVNIYSGGPTDIPDLDLASFTLARAPSERTMRVNGVDLRYVDQGTGAPVVFVHGALLDHRYWEPQREAVVERHRFVSYTARYHGTAPWPDDGAHHSAATHAADLAGFLRGLDTGPVHLVGHSVGGLVAALVAEEHPELVRTLTLVEAAIRSVLADVAEARPLVAERTAIVAAVAEAVKAGDAERAARLLFDWVSNGGPGALDRQPAGLRGIWLDNAKTARLFVSAPPPPAISCADLSRLGAPTMIVGGESTRPLFSLINDVLVRCIQGSRAVVIPEAAHFASYRNSSAFDDALLQFVDH